MLSTIYGIAFVVSEHYAMPTMLLTQNIKTTPRWGTLIKQMRIKRGLSKASLGRLFGVSGQAVHYWETGQSDPPGDVTWWVYKGGKI